MHTHGGNHENTSLVASLPALNFEDNLAYTSGWFSSKVGLVSGAIRQMNSAVTADFTTPKAAKAITRPNTNAIAATVANLTTPRNSTATEVVIMEVKTPTVTDAPIIIIPVTSS